MSLYDIIDIHMTRLMKLMQQHNYYKGKQNVLNVDEVHCAHTMSEVVLHTSAR